MTSSLIPEKPLTISPSLAATIGLEEAVMLQALHERMKFSKSSVRDGYKWFAFEQAQLAETFPFWQAGDVQRIANSLRDKGVVLLGADNYLVNKVLDVALNEKVVSAVALEPLPVASAPESTAAKPASRTSAPFSSGQTSGGQLGAQKMSREWQPGAEIIKQLKQEQGIPENFIRQCLPEFIAYWVERGEAHHGWHAKFRSHVTREWGKEEAKSSASTPSSLASGWQPDDDARLLLERAGVSRDFIDEAIPEFVLYWREKGEGSATWNTKFVQHVRRQWARYTNAIQHETELRIIPADWQPSLDVFDILTMATIDADFAKKLIPEFILYWRDKKELHSSWNSKFLHHVKYQWARRHDIAAAASKNSQGFIERHTDKSWREGL